VQAVHASARVARHAVVSVLEAALILAIVASLVMAFAVVTHGAPGGASSVFAGKSGGGKPKPGGTSGSLAVVMVDDANGDGSPNWNDTITFKVTTSAATPSVDVRCTQHGTLVYSASAGFYASYPWPGARNMPLYSPMWTGGAASCTAVINTGGSLSFSVGA
jgi:hypothetical protein